MCLDRLAEFRVTKDYGWQVFGKSKTGLVQLYHHPFQRHPTLVTEGTWQADSNGYFLRSYSCIFVKYYKTGFHLFTNKKDALRFASASNGGVIRKVRFRNLVAKGRQRLPSHRSYPSREANVIVVRERFVEPETKREESKNVSR